MGKYLYIHKFLFSFENKKFHENCDNKGYKYKN